MRLAGVAKLSGNDRIWNILVLKQDHHGWTELRAACTISVPPFGQPGPDQIAR